ncbi:MAG TPA: TRAP transporter small permease [Syntrophorhabdaceae bacterium]|nr:TRAP transporter small permease [Syntrophorhabdaceae bacterium]HPU30059.1 TRAP transporter small permease [Syntrophorhabdaceae bacterium]
MAFYEIIKKFNRFLFIIGGFAVVFMMFLTVADTILRYFKRPIIGTYELVGLSAAIVLGFSIPYTTSLKGHIIVDFFVMKFKPKTKKFWYIITRIMGIFLFLFIGYEMFVMATDLKNSGEVSATLQLPFYPIAYGIGVCLFFQVITLIADTILAIKGEGK